MLYDQHRKLKLEINDGPASVVMSDFGSNSLSTNKIGVEGHISITQVGDSTQRVEKHAEISTGEVDFILFR